MALMGRKRKETAGGAAEASDLERLRRDLDAAQAECDAAERAHADLDAGRDAALASEDVAELERHDTAVAAIERRVAVARARVERLAGEVEAAESAAEQARRRAAYEAGERALAEGRRVLEREYLPAAKALAEILSRANALRHVVMEANKSLPDGAAPLSTMLEAEFDGQYYPDVRGLTKTETYFVNRKTGLRAGSCDCPEYAPTAHLWERRERAIDLPLPLHPAVEHRSVLEYVNLPGISGPDSYLWSAPFWGRPRGAHTNQTQERDLVL